MTTTAQLMERANLACLVADIVADIEVPVLAAPQRQGDVSIWPDHEDGIRPVTDDEAAAATPVPPEGVAVVRGEASGNTHLLLADGDVSWLPATGDIELGALIVGDGGVAHLIHTDEHTSSSIAPGRYRLHGKREQAEEVRRVAD